MIVTDNVIVEAFLPNVLLSMRTKEECCPPFERPDQSRKVASGTNATEQQMAMIRHEAIGVEIEKMVASLFSD